MIQFPPLPECPFCRYNLTGLPSEHRCPECGFAYNARMIVFRPKRPWRIYIPIIAAQLAVGYFVGFPILGFFLTIFGIYIGSLWVFFLVAVFTYNFIWLHRRNAKGRFALLKSDGLFIHNLTREKQVPWNRLSQCSIVDWHPWIKETGIDQTITLRGIFDSSREKKSLKQLVAAYQAAAIRDDSDPPSEFLEREIQSHRRNCAIATPRVPIKWSPMLKVGIILFVISMAPLSIMKALEVKVEPWAIAFMLPCYFAYGLIGGGIYETIDRTKKASRLLLEKQLANQSPDQQPVSNHSVPS